MLKLLLKLIFSVAAVMLLWLMHSGTQQSDPKILTALIASLGVAVLTAVDLWDFYKSKMESEEKNSIGREKRIRNIQFNFKHNYFENLNKIGVFKDKEEVTIERIYAMSQDHRIISLLNDNEFYPVVDELNEFSQLYEMSR